MPKYRVSFIVHASTVPIEIEAANEEQAEAKANQLVYAGLCHHCSDRIELGDIGEAFVEEVDP